MARTAPMEWDEDQHEAENRVRTALMETPIAKKLVVEEKAAIRKSKAEIKARVTACAKGSPKRKKR